MEDWSPVAEGSSVEILQLLPPFRRVFLISKDGNYVMQLQTDFFGHNWRKTRAMDAYPSFAMAKRLFLEKWELFRKFVAENKLGELQLTRYDVTYVNHLIENPGVFPRAIEKYTPLIQLRAAAPEHFLPDPKSLLADLQFGISENQGELRVAFKQGVRQFDKAEVMQLDLSARNKAEADGSDVEKWLELAHEWIVRGFTDLTSKDAHQQWKRTQ